MLLNLGFTYNLGWCNYRFGHFIGMEYSRWWIYCFAYFAFLHFRPYLHDPTNAGQVSSFLRNVSRTKTSSTAAAWITSAKMLWFWRFWITYEKLAGSIFESSFQFYENCEVFKKFGKFWQSRVKTLKCRSAFWSEKSAFSKKLHEFCRGDNIRQH